MKSKNFLLNVLLFISVLNFSEEQARKLYCVVPTTANINGSCYKLDFCVQNVKQYFTSNTEIKLMAGEHHLISLLSVNNVTNLSIIGETNATIWCHTAYILIANSASVEIRNIKFINCGKGFGSVTNKASLTLHNVTSFRITNTAFQNSFGYAITGTNIQGNSSFENINIFQDITLSRHNNMYRIIQLIFQEVTNNQEAHILINECRFYNITLQEFCTDDDCNLAAIEFSFSQQSYLAKIQMENMIVANVTSNGGPLVDVSYSSMNRNDSQVTFFNNIFTNNKNKNHSTIHINILSSKQTNSKYLSQQRDTEKVP